MGKIEHAFIVAKRVVRRVGCRFGFHSGYVLEGYFWCKHCYHLIELEHTEDF